MRPLRQPHPNAQPHTRPGTGPPNELESAVGDAPIHTAENAGAPSPNAEATARGQAKT